MMPAAWCLGVYKDRLSPKTCVISQHNADWYFVTKVNPKPQRLPAQMALSILYVARGDSLPATIIAHATNNAVVVLLTTSIAMNWHFRIWLH
jgi:hypothetical protein